MSKERYIFYFYVIETVFSYFFTNLSGSGSLSKDNFLQKYFFLYPSLELFRRLCLMNSCTHVILKRKRFARFSIFFA